MNKDLYILYDSKIEDSDSLAELDKVLLLAGFEQPYIKHISLEEYQQKLEETNYNFYPFVLAVNNTYKEINTIYSEKLDIPLFDFFSKEYVNYDKRIALYGLLFSIKTVFLKTHKKYSWGIITKLFQDYSKLIENIEDENPSCSYLEASTPSLEETITQIPEEVEEQQELIVETISEKELSYDFLLSFYQETKEFIKLFKIISNKVVDNEISE